jgi:hypothetical protein
MNCRPRFCRPVETFSSRHAVGDQRRGTSGWRAWTASCLGCPLRERHRRKAGYGKLAAAVALVELPARTRRPVRCAAPRSTPSALATGDEEHLIEDGGKHVSVGDTVPVPGTWQGQTGTTKPTVDGGESPGRRLPLWSQSGAVASWYQPLEVWRTWADEVHGGPIAAGHFLPEEAHDQTARHLVITACRMLPPQPRQRPLTAAAAALQCQEPVSHRPDAWAGSVVP